MARMTVGFGVVVAHDPVADPIVALTGEAVRLGGQSCDLQASIDELATSSGGDAALLIAAREQLLEEMIAGLATHAAKTGLFLLRCAALQIEMT